MNVSAHDPITTTMHNGFSLIFLFTNSNSFATTCLCPLPFRSLFSFPKFALVENSSFRSQRLAEPGTQTAQAVCQNSFTILVTQDSSGCVPKIMHDFDVQHRQLITASCGADVAKSCGFELVAPAI